MKIRLEIPPLHKTHGQFLYRPACALSRTLADSTFRKKNVKLAQIQILVKEGVDIEYIGYDCPILDKLGAKHLEKFEE